MGRRKGRFLLIACTTIALCLTVTIFLTIYGHFKNSRPLALATKSSQTVIPISHGSPVANSTPVDLQYPTARIPAGWSAEAGHQSAVPAESPPSSNTAVKLISGFDGSMPLVSRNIDDTHLVIRFPSTATIWYLFRLENVRGRSIQVEFQNVRADRWVCNRPVYCEAANLTDPTSESRGSTQEWKQISKVWGTNDAVRFEQKFDGNTVFVAARTPYTDRYNDRYLRSLPEQAGVTIEHIGQSLSGRSMDAVIFSESAEAEKTRPCLLVYAGEHANEPDACWAAQGMIHFLLSNDDQEAKELRRRYTIIIIPQLDPDGAAAGAYDRMTETFCEDHKCVESEQYGRWFEQWVLEGNRLDVVIDLHNPALGPYLNLNIPHLDDRQPYALLATAANKSVISVIEKSGFSDRPDPWNIAQLPRRLAGWLSTSFGPLVLPYEINSQGINSKFLSVNDMRKLGDRMLTGIAAFLESDKGHALVKLVNQRRSERSNALVEWASLFKQDESLFAHEDRLRWYMTGEGSPMPP